MKLANMIGTPVSEASTVYFQQVTVKPNPPRALHCIQNLRPDAHTVFFTLTLLRQYPILPPPQTELNHVTIYGVVVFRDYLGSASISMYIP